MKALWGLWWGGSSGYLGPGIIQIVYLPKGFPCFPCTQAFWTVTERDFHGLIFYSRVFLFTHVTMFKSLVVNSASISQFGRPQKVVQFMVFLDKWVPENCTLLILFPPSLNLTVQHLWRRSIGQVALNRTAENANWELWGKIKLWIHTSGKHHFCKTSKIW